ncbi:hypothetical protein KPH14_000983 [Odynerus spinipes]|uniref:DUF4795 domain-containing protein n=1 Tax=Odynerus spinipes TaxID=1348599 RepID=A0AAD9VLV1_9HYME|nr:hypothetical protein KPH14_000983 [Odynerus spinipes]
MAAKTARAQVHKTPAATSVEVASLQVSLPQMLDLALGTPEVGAVNLNILHNFLHVLLHQINLRTTKVEYRGEDAKRMKTMVASAKSGPALHLHEYSITDGSGKIKQRIHSTDQLTINVDVFSGDQSAKSGQPSASAPATPRKNDKERGSKLPTDGQAADTVTKKTKGVKQQISSGTEGQRESVIFVEPIIDGATPTALGFKQLEQSVQNLEQKFQALEELSTNPELVERLKGNITDPLSDMWQIININKRLDASEQGINKLTSMVQDVIKNAPTSEPTEDVSNLEQRLASVEQNVANVEQIVINLQSTQETTAAPGSSTEKNAETASKPAPRLSGLVDLNALQGDVSTLKTEMLQTQKDMQDLKTKLDSGLIGEQDNQEASAEERTAQEGEKQDKPQEQRRDSSIQKCLENVQNIETTFNTMDARVKKLEEEVALILEKLSNITIPGESGDDELNELVSKIQGIQEDMRKLNDTADRLIDEKEDGEMNLNAMLEQIELLKTIKADKEDLEDALADKADAQAVNRKVSHDQFDAACDDLARGLEEAINKLGKQESIWQQALDEVQREIEGKVDKIEITPLREFVNNKLKSLQDKMKRIAEMRREAEAAGTKRVLRDVQCISCDKDVVMRVEESGKFETPPMPCTMSMKPYLTYELDQVRKQQRRLPHSRNMIQFEAAVLEEAKKMKITKEETLAKSPRDHLCNRYCGGSHTVTTPQQRVMRMGHFLTQWGPETVQLTDGMIQGTDGKMYRSRPMPAKFDVCGSTVPCTVNEAVLCQEPPKCTPRKSSQPRYSARSLSSTTKRNSKKETLEEQTEGVDIRPVEQIEIQATTGA